LLTIAKFFCPILHQLISLSELFALYVFMPGSVTIEAPCESTFWTNYFQSLKEYLKNEVKQRNVRIHCINCDSYVHRDEILALLPTELKEKYYQFLLEENKDPNIKTCPRCCMLQNKKDILPNSHKNINLFENWINLLDNLEFTLKLDSPYT
jgi:hypothetical protein